VPPKTRQELAQAMALPKMKEALQGSPKALGNSVPLVAQVLPESMPAEPPGPAEAQMGRPGRPMAMMEEQAQQKGMAALLWPQEPGAQLPMTVLARGPEVVAASERRFRQLTPLRPAFAPRQKKP
jgi:hypothetical protein